MTMDTYKFMGADVNPTAKKIENGKPTNELYKKETIYNILKQATLDGRIVDSLKITNMVEEYVKYIFKTKNQNIEVLIPNPNFISGDVNIKTINSQTKADNELSNVDYINKFDDLVKSNVNIIYKNMLKNMALALSTVAIVGSMVGGIIYSDIKETELRVQQNQNLINEMNEQRRQNGVGPISYSASLENVVDEAIENTSLGGRKL